jgi:hypothetical protein
VFYAYLCIDINKFSLDLHNLINKSSIIDYINNDIKDDNDNKYINNVSKEIDNVGRFILISNQDIDHREVIRHYYSRQQIEQVFDISKNHCGLLPLRGHSEDVIKGHLMVSFIASIITLFINKKLYDVKLSSLDVFFALKNLYINIYDQSSIIDEPTKHENDIINILNLQTTHKIEVRKYNNTKLSNLTVRRKPGRPKGRLGRLIKFKQSSPTPISSTDNLNNSNHTCIETGFSEGSNVLVKPKRGRPLGSRNKSKQPDNDLSSERLGTQDKPKRGRPLGSRNKTKQSDDSLPSEGSGAINKPKRGSPLGSHNK